MREGHALAAGAAATLAALIALILWLTAAPDGTPEPAAASPATTAPDAGAHAITTGAASVIVPMPWPSPAGSATVGPDIAIALDDNQALIADAALRSVMDFYLLDGRLSALREHLLRVLPPGAAREALSLAERYNTYLAEHDSLLAAQHFTDVPDAARLAVWQQQRHQLRVRLLGERVTEEWFGTEEAYLGQALAELAPGPAPEPAQSDENDMRHRAHMRQVLRHAVTGARGAYGANR